MDITLNVKELVTLGYVFIGPTGNAQPGPYIYDSQGVSRIDTSEKLC